MQTREDLMNVMLAIALVMGFVMTSASTVFYIREKYGASDSCGCWISLPFVMILLSSAGIFVGAIIYYLLAKSFFKEKKNIKASLQKTLNFLETEEKTIVKALIENKGKITQNKLNKITGIDSVKLHRRVTALVAKGICQKEKHGMTNMIILDDDLKNIFLD